MYFFTSSLTAFIVLSIFNTSIASSIISVKPNFIKMRHAATVQVNVTDLNDKVSLSLIPGGPYIKKSKVTSPLSVINKNQLIQVENKTQIVIYQANSSSWQELGFIETNAKNPIRKLHINNKTLLVKTKDEIITIDITRAALPFIKNRQAINAVGIQTKNNLCSFNSALLSRSIKILTFKKYCVTLHPNDGIHVFEMSKTKNPIIKSHYQPNTIARDIIIADNLIAVANGTTGMTLLKIDNTGTLNWVGSYNKLGNITNIAYDNNHILTADDKGVLSIFDISNPATPLLISDFHTHLSIDTVTFYNKQSYILSNNTIVNVDFKSNSSPMISTLGVNQGGSRRSFIENDILYVADWFSGLHLYDIRNPFAPRLLSSFHTPGSPKGVVVKSGIAFVADDDHGLQVIDVSNPRAPVFVSEIPLSGLAYTMKLIDNLLYIASHRGGFHIVDVSNPKLPILVSTYDTPSKAWALEYQNGLLYVADDSTGLMIFDVKDPKHPQLINQFNPGGFAEDIILKDNKAYIAFFDLGLFIVDITDPLKLKTLAKLKTPGNARGIEIRNHLLYLASWEAGVQIIDISDNQKPFIAGHYDTKGAVWGLSVGTGINEGLGNQRSANQKTIIYAMDWWGGIKIIDATHTQNPQLISQYQTAGLINDIQYHNKFIYTAHGSRGLQVYDASNDLNPVWATGVDIGGNAKAITINAEKNLAIIAAGDGGIIISDISNPFHTRLLGQLNLGVSIDFIETKNNTVFAAEENGDLFIVDIQKPSIPRLLNRITTKTTALSLNDEKLFILNNNQTLDVYLVNNLTKNVTKQEYALPIRAKGLHILKHNAFILQSQNTLMSCRIEQHALSCHEQTHLPASLLSLHVANKHLYATATNNTLYVFNIKNNGALVPNTIYPTSHNINRISSSKGGIFFGGEPIIASGKLLPQLNITKHTDHFNIEIPANMPKGAYHLALTHADGTQSIKKNAVIIGFPKLKSKFTLEQLKAIMKQKNFEGKAPTAP